MKNILFNLLFIISTLTNAFAENCQRETISDTITIHLTGQLKGAKLEKHTSSIDSEDTDFSTEINEFPDDYSKLATIDISGVGDGSVTVLVQFSKGWQQTCTLQIIDTASAAKPQVALSEECPSYWEITSLTGSQGNYQVYINGKS